MKVYFSRRQNDFEHVYDLPSVPRVGEHVGLLDSPVLSGPRVFVVTSVYWSPDHTEVDVSVGLEELAQPEQMLTYSFEITEDTEETRKLRDLLD